MIALTRRQIWILAIVLGTILCITLFIAPRDTSQRQGSTYGRSPDGYAAWYAEMERRGTPVRRWQKPLSELFNPSTQFQETSFAPSAPDPTRAQATFRPVDNSSHVTLLRIGNRLPPPNNPAEREWIRKGNVLVQLGARSPVTKAPFTSDISSPVGSVRIETSRRARDAKTDSLLEDSFGAVVWQETIGQGRVVYASTPFLAANAYQDFQGNFEFLTKLVIQAGYPIWVDEYLHGYKDANVIQKETPGNVIAYLMRTPLILIGIQAVVLLGVLIWGQNQRLGQPIVTANPAADNSEAYIQAMAAVLRKAECSEFVVETVGKAEQLEIQKALGLGTELLSLETIVDAWAQQTGRAAAELETVLRTAQRHRRVSESDLMRWVENIQMVHQHLP